MAASRPELSILLPIYNAERFLPEALDSIVTQSFRDFELICMNDGSCDGSLAILEKYRDADPRIRIVSRPNQGLIRTLNEAIGLARAPLASRMDADDLSLPGRLHGQVEFLRKNPECVAVGCYVSVVDADGWPLLELKMPLTHEEIDGHHIAGGSGGVPHAAATFRIAALREIGGYREGFQAAEDLDLFLRLAEVGQLANLPEVLYVYRQHLQSVSYQQKGVQAESCRSALVQARDRRGLPPLGREPVEDRPRLQPSRGKQHRRWALWALRAGNLRTARKHAFAALRREPLHRDSWRILKWVIRGH